VERAAELVWGVLLATLQKRRRSRVLAEVKIAETFEWKSVTVGDMKAGI
jgi:hypothetical protein